MGKRINCSITRTCCQVSVVMDAGFKSGDEYPTIVGPKTFARFSIGILQCGERSILKIKLLLNHSYKKRYTKP